jgi:hypothetical protein
MLASLLRAVSVSLILSLYFDQARMRLDNRTLSELPERAAERHGCPKWVRE